MNSQQLINKAKERFESLKDKGFDWKSFFNGYLEASVSTISIHEQLEEKYKAVNDLETELKEKTDWKLLREKYFRECTYGNVDDLVKVGLAPHDLFEWFKKNMSSDCNHKYVDNVCDNRGVRKCIICSKLEN